MSETANRTICCFCHTSSVGKRDIERVEVHSNVRPFTQERFPLWRCPNCRSIHSERIVDLDPYYAVYPVHGQKLDSIARMMFGRRLKFMRQAGIKPTDAVLDYGCANGTFMELLAEKGFKNIAGWDKYSETFGDMSVFDHRYDAIVCGEVIEHVEDPYEVLQRLARALNEGGTAVITCPNADRISLARPDWYCWEMHQPYHIHIPTESSLVGMGREYGLTPVRVSYDFYADIPLPFLNLHFVKKYLRHFDNEMNFLLESGHQAEALKHPSLLIDGFTGCFRSGGHGYMNVAFRKTANSTTRLPVAA